MFCVTACIILRLTNLHVFSTLYCRSGSGDVVSRRGPNAADEELEFALALSRHLEEEETRKRRHEEEDSQDEELQRILKLSLEEK